MSDTNEEAKLARLRQVIIDSAETLVTGDYGSEVHLALNDIVLSASQVLRAAREAERMLRLSEAMSEAYGEMYPDDKPN